ncbi:hypothetical protein VT52_030710 [Streptomyces malaysiense]|uniref:Uncharacterized protein n=2 Tax=Streptomyces malaysiense TaxID=1428626 RepID=A0A1J4PUQ8_9ACTN|nr:hypothetical protein VT52_030710 [Streptomyces malaysiense]
MAQQAGAAANVLWGVALHAAARLEAGQELSDLEAMLATALARLLPGDEVLEMGRAWEQVRARGGATPFPDRITGLTLGDSYSLADLRADLPAIGKEVLAQPTTNVVRVGDSGFPAEIDSEEFVSACEEVGGGVTVVLGPEGAERARSELSCELHLPYFHCHKSTGDSAFGGRDEIYWTMASGSDQKEQHIYGSPEFGAVEDGDRRSFPAGAGLFIGTVQEVLFVDIECWEKDRGGFWETIKDSLFDVAEACVDSAVDVMEHGEKEDAALAALVGIVFAIMGALLDIILGNDDLIQHRTLSFNRSALDALVDQRGGDFHFKGEGAHYTLRIGARKLPSHMQYITLDQGSSAWSGRYNMPGMHSLDNPGTTTTNGLLHCVVRPPGTNRLDFTSFDGFEWSPPRQEILSGAMAGVGMASTSGGMTQMVTVNAALRPATYALYADGDLGSSESGPMFTTVTPDIAYAIFDELHGVFRPFGSDQLVCSPINSWGGWDDPVTIPDSAGLLGPSLARHNADLHLVHRSTNGDRLKHHVFRNGQWTSKGFLNDHFSTHRPALASFDGKLHCVYRGHNNINLWWTTWDGTAWAPSKLLAATASTGPALTVLGDRLYCVFPSHL